LEAGVGTATVQALYRPVAEDDRSSINSILSATSHFYQRTGTIYLALVLLLAIIFTVFIDTSIPRYQVFLVVLMSGLSGVISYYFQGKFRLLLTAEGKKYIITGINTATHVGVSIFKAVVLLAGGSVAAVQGVYFVFNLLQMLVYYIYARKHYGWINYKAVPDFEAISQRNSVLVHQAATLIFRNTDVVLLTIFTSLKTVSVYSMYAMICGMVGTITSILTNSFIYMLGQSFQNNFDIENYVQFFLYGGTLAVVVTAVFICTNWMFNRDTAKIAVQYISRNVKERLKKHDA
jgi:O-antigen/teichoic acid export membrane protein